MPHAELASAKNSAADSAAKFDQSGALDAQGAAKRFLPFSAGKSLLHEAHDIMLCCYSAWALARR